MNSVLDSASLSALAIVPNNLVLYGFNIVNDEAALVQSGSSYFDMQVVDSALTSSNSSELTCGDIIKRLPNLMTFELPLFFRNAFIIAKLDFEGGVDDRYHRILLEYGSGERKEISRGALTSANHRDQIVMMGSYGGMVFYEEEQKHNRFVIQTYGNQRYFSANVLIGVTV